MDVLKRGRGQYSAGCDLAIGLRPFRRFLRIPAIEVCPRDHDLRCEPPSSRPAGDDYSRTYQVTDGGTVRLIASSGGSALL
jgi:hypothetical protein